MIDTCTITRAGSVGSFDPATGLTTPAVGSQVYTGPCLVMARDVAGSEPDAGGQPVSLRAYVVSLPVTATAVEPGDQVHVDASADPGAAARTLTVETIDAVTVATMRRLFCTHDQG